MLRYTEERNLNINVYHKLREYIKKKYWGRYVAIVKGQLIASADTFDEALRKSESAFPEALHRLVFNADDDSPITEDEDI